MTRNFQLRMEPDEFGRFEEAIKKRGLGSKQEAGLIAIRQWLDGPAPASPFGHLTKDETACLHAVLELMRDASARPDSIKSTIATMGKNYSKRHG